MVAWLATIAAAVAMTKAGQYMASAMIKGITMSTKLQNVIVYSDSAQCR